MKRLMLCLAIGFLAMSIGGGALAAASRSSGETIQNRPMVPSAAISKKAGRRRTHPPTATAQTPVSLLPVLQRVSRPIQGNVLLAEGEWLGRWSVAAG